MPFSIEIVPSAVAELQEIAVFWRRQLAQTIDQQLVSQPLVATRNRKLLGAPRTSFDCEPPIWELRVGRYRIFYDVDEVARIVYVRAVRDKPPHATTEQIL
jgi:mRNA-degrading endonuclease RelE of RelBE toxin-antitoxin system